MITTEYIEGVEIKVDSNNFFDYHDEKKYLKLFDKLTKEGYLKENQKFYDKKWIRVKKGEEQGILFPTEIEVKILSKLFEMSECEFEMAYRSFLLYEIPNSITTADLNRKIKQLTIDIKYISTDISLIGRIKNFLDYLNLNSKTYEYLLDQLYEFEKKDIGERVLPRFEDIFKFADIINDIVENQKINTCKDYLLTILWWKITSILPLRPTEFLRIEFDCIYREKDSFYLIVKRSKGKSGGKIHNNSKTQDFYKDDYVAIDEDLYNLIIEYKEILKSEFQYTTNEKLFPFELIQKQSNKNREYNKELIVCNDLLRNINNFYQNVIYKKYNFIPVEKYEKLYKETKFIEKLTTYDARHIAIMNLILMGNDPLEVMYLAGHSDVNTSFGYFNHIETYATSYALGLIDNIKNKTMINEYKEKYNFRNSGKETFDLLKNDMSVNERTPKKVRGGYCYYPNIEIDKSICFFYERNHCLCDYFIEEDIEIINKELNKIELDLRSDIKVLQDLVRDMTGISKFNELYKTTSYKIKNNIKNLSELKSKKRM